MKNRIVIPNKPRQMTASKVCDKTEVEYRQGKEFVVEEKECAQQYGSIALGE